MRRTGRFRDRVEAGKLLGEELRRSLPIDGDIVVLGLPRGGVPVAHEVAAALGAPLDVFLVRKLGVPGHEELAMGAIASGGVRVLNDAVVRQAAITSQQLDRVTEHEQAELERRAAAYRPADSAPLEVAGRTVVVVDDGLATGSTMRAAVTALRAMCPERVIVAVPTGASQTCAELQREADEVVCLTTPEPYFAVGQSYDDFSPTTDDEVRRLLR